MNERGTAIPIGVLVVLIDLGTTIAKREVHLFQLNVIL